MILDIIKFLTFFILAIYPLGRATLFQITELDEVESTKSFILGLLIVSISPKLVIPLTVICWIYIFKKIKFVPPVYNWRLITLVVFLTIINSQVFYSFGQVTPRGISLPGAHFIDSTWHLALINSLLRSVPPENPGYAGVILSNYHYFTDLQMTVMHQITHIPVEKIFFLFMGPAYLFLTSYSLYRFVYKAFESKFMAVFGVLLVMGASNWYYLSKYIYPLATVSPSVAWMDFYSSKIVNFPLLYSLALLFVLLDLILNSKLKLKSIIILGTISGLMFLVKSHTALILILSLLILGFLKAFEKKWQILAIALIGGIVLLILARSNLSGGSATLIFSPFWFIKVMYESPFHLNTPDWELRRQFLLSIGAYLGVLRLYLQGLLVFLVINFAFGLIGVAYFFFKFFISRDVEKMLVIVFAVSVGLTLSFIYRYSTIVTIQFIYLAFVSSQLLFLGLLQKYKVSVIIVIVYWLSLLPGVLFINSQYVGATGQIDVSPKITQALLFMQDQSEGTIFNSPEFWSGSYISAYSHHPVYLGDLDTARGSGIDTSQREKLANQFFTCRKKLIDKIEYVFTTANTCVDNSTEVIKIFSNSEISIYRKQK